MSTNDNDITLAPKSRATEEAEAKAAADKAAAEKAEKDKADKEKAATAALQTQLEAERSARAAEKEQAEKDKAALTKQLSDLAAKQSELEESLRKKVDLPQSAAVVVEPTVAELQAQISEMKQKAAEAPKMDHPKILADATAAALAAMQEKSDRDAIAKMVAATPEAERSLLGAENSTLAQVQSRFDVLKALRDEKDLAVRQAKANQAREGLSGATPAQRAFSTVGLQNRTKTSQDRATMLASLRERKQALFGVR